MFESFDLTKFGDCLRRLRASLGYTQREAAELSRLATDTLRRIERGEVVPRYETLIYLSHTYKKDLLVVLRSYCSANAIFDFYYRLEDVIINNDLDALAQLAQDFDEYMSKGSWNNLVNMAVANQFKLMLSGTAKRYSSKRTDAFQDILAAMRISHPNFEPEGFTQFKYTEFELRILFMLAASLPTEKVNVSIEMMHFCLEHLDESMHATLHEKLLRIKVYFNLSYSYHRIDDHARALYYANEGIRFCTRNYLSHYLAGLLYRKGIAKFHLGEEDYLESLQHSIQMLRIQGARELAERYRKVTEETYGICLDY